MRLQKVTPDFLEVAVTLDDPIVFERPWSTVKRYARAPADYYVQEYACFEGNRYRIGADGNVEIVSEEPAGPWNRRGNDVPANGASIRKGGSV